MEPDFSGIVILTSDRPLLTRIRDRVWPTLPTTLDNNIRLLYIEIFFAAVMGGVAGFNSAFAVRLGATNAEIGLLNSVPPLIAAVLFIPAARFLERQADRRPYILWSLLLYRLGYLGVALMPIIAPANTATWVVIWLILLNAPATMFVAGWNPLIADILPERRRAFVFSRRNIINFSVAAIVAFLAGRYLSAAAFPYNYMTIYAFGAAAALVSSAIVEQLRMPKTEVIAERRKTQQRIRIPHVSWVEFRRIQTQGNRAFRVMTFNSLIFNFGAWMSMPLFILYYLRVLNADDGWIGLHSAFGSGATVVGYYVWERVIRQRGFTWVLMRTIPFSPIYVFLIVLFPSLTPILFFHALVGFINSGLDLSHFNVLLKLCPRERRTSYLGYYNTIMNGVMFLAPLVSVALADRIGLGEALFVSGVVRLVGGLLFWVLRVHEPPEEPWTPSEA
ncbi:MAG: hypothetical protein Kow00120_20450 [Anaerolineae bacterium]